MIPFTSSQLGLVDLTLAVLMLRGHQPDVLEWMFALLRDICSFGGYRPLVLASPHDPVYNIIRMTVKHCMKKGVNVRSNLNSVGFHSWLAC